MLCRQRPLNQTFVEGPEGVVVIDTGESNEEMASALVLREVTTAPIAVIYTHFHYVAGTQAVLDEVGGDIDIWGHHGIVGNRRRVTSEVSAAASRGSSSNSACSSTPTGRTA